MEEQSTSGPGNETPGRQTQIRKKLGRVTLRGSVLSAPAQPNPGQTARWASIFLGFLMALFVVALLATGYLFLSWSRSGVAAVANLPALDLPRLVKPAPPAQSQPVSNAPAPLWQVPGAAPAQPVAVSAAGVAPAAAPTPTPTAGGRVTILLMGVDNRPDEKVETTRTDTIMVLTANPDAGSAGMLSIPRDMVVEVPALGQQAKINTIHPLGYINRYPGGGPEMLKDTVASFLGYPIDYYVRVNFDGFRQIVDLLGGIDIDVPQPIFDPTYPDNNYGYDPLYIPAGHVHMDGDLALKYARTRHTDSDYGRAQRQQQVILAVKARLSRAGTLAGLLPRLPSLAVAMANSVQTDMPIDRAILLARLLDQVDLANPTRVVIDNTMGTETNDPSLGFVLEPDLTRVHTAAAAVFAEASGPSPEEALRQSLKRENARVIVLNGTGTPGLAEQTAQTLVDAGYNVIAVGDADNTAYDQSWLVTFGDAGPTTREALLRQFGIASDRIRSEPPSTEYDLAVVAGHDLLPAVPR